MVSNNNNNNNNKIELSPSAINLFLECPSCFWLDKVKKIKRPETPSSSLPSGMDRLIKDYFDKYRNLQILPPEIEGKVKGKLFDNQEKMKNWRSWQSTELKYFDENLNAVLRGGLDECLVYDDYYIPVDYKTRGYDLKDDSEKYYQYQLDCYTFLLEVNGYKTMSLGYLFFYIPVEIKENNLVQFKVEVKEMKTDIERAKRVFEEAVKFLKGPQPEINKNCQFCLYRSNGF